MKGKVGALLFNVEQSQNVEQSRKFTCEKPLMEQLEIMEEYTAVHRSMLDSSKEEREVACLKVIFPRLLRTIQNQDLFAGRLDFLPTRRP